MTARTNLCLVASLIFSLGSVLAGCATEESSRPCDAGTVYPICSSTDEQLLISCLEGRENENRCFSDDVCLDATDSAGSRVSSCVDVGTASCDIETFTAACQGESGFIACREVAGLEGTGTTDITNCINNKVCKENESYVACVPVDAEVCDDEYLGECQGNQPVICQFYGFTEVLEACDAPLECKVSTRGAACVEPEQQPCDDDYVERCEDDGNLTRCLFGWTEERICDESQACRESDTTARCADASIPTCEADTFEQRCEDNDRVRCDAFGLETITTCDQDRQCATNDRGAHCVEIGAVACDPDGFETFCDEGAVVQCNRSTGFTYRQECGDGELCRHSDESGWTQCVDESGVECDSESFEPTCNDSVATDCNGFVNWTASQTCPEEQMCAVVSYQDDSWAVCVDDDSEPCELDNYASSCNGDIADTCNLFNLHTFQTQCSENEACVVDTMCFGADACGEFALCVEETTPRCEVDPKVVCDGASVDYCFGGYLFEFGCANGEVCVTEDDETYACVEGE